MGHRGGHRRKTRGRRQRRRLAPARHSSREFGQNLLDELLVREIGGGFGQVDPPFELEHPQSVTAEGSRGLDPPELVGELPEQDVVHHEDADGGPGLPRAGPMLHLLEFHRGRLVQSAVDAGDVGVEQFAGARRGPLVDGPRRPVQSGSASEAVPVHGDGTEHLGGASLGSQPHVLDLPGAVERAGPPLPVQGCGRGRAPHVRDAPVVADDLAGHRRHWAPAMT